MGFLEVPKTKISKKGNAHIRRILHMPAFSVVASNEPIFKNLLLISIKDKFFFGGICQLLTISAMVSTSGFCYGFSFL